MTTDLAYHTLESKRSIFTVWYAPYIYCLENGHTQEADRYARDLSELIGRMALAFDVVSSFVSEYNVARLAPPAAQGGFL